MKQTPSASATAAASGVLNFDAAIRDVGIAGANASASYFIVPALNISHCLYWMHIGLEVPATTQANVQLSTATNFSFFINKIDIDRSPGTISRSGLVQLEPGTHVSVISRYQAASAYWSGFLLNNLMNPLVAFYVGKSNSSSPYNHSISIGNLKHLTYDTIVVNEGNGWNAENSQFRALHAGIYLFSVSVAKNGNMSTAWMILVSLVVNNPGEPNYAVYGMGKMDLDSNDNMNTMSTSHLINLAKNDTVRVNCPDTSTLYSDPGTLATSLSGFYYSPMAVDNVTQVLCIVVCKRRRLNIYVFKNIPK
jgi:hypothetical protein